MFEGFIAAMFMFGVVVAALFYIGRWIMRETMGANAHRKPS
jgi:hypothetical protein